MSDFTTEYASYCAAHGTPERIELMLCDLNAVLRGKWLPGDEADKLATGQVRLPMSTYVANILGEEVDATGLGSAVGDPDGWLVPVAGSLRPKPWVQEHAVQVLVELTDSQGMISPLSSRQILRRMVARFTAHGLHPVVATELEFYILRPRERACQPPVPPDRAPRAQNYDLEVLDRAEDILTDILAASGAQGLATDTLIAEYGPGQFEINFKHTEDVLAAADTALMFRRLVRGVVASHGMEATFMAKPYAEHPGNGMHVHVSLVDDDGNNIFAAGGAVSAKLRAAVSGGLSTMRAMQAIFAPHMNSYRRFQPGSFSPSAPDWGFDHRGAAIRLPEIAGPGARLEHRICGADVNPYLALAAILGGILRGLDAPAELPPPLDDPAAVTAAPLGHDWRAAVTLFAQSDFAAEVFGKAFRDIYAAVRHDEIATLTTPITPAEYQYYLSRL